MDNAMQQVLAEVQAKIKTHLDEITKLKKTANNLADLAGEAPIYTDIDQDTSSGVGPTRPDAYYGKPLATAVREYLEFRRKAVPSEEILKGLEQGGFDFGTLGWTESGRLRALAMSMSKNTPVFHRLPNGTWGLLTWYPSATQKREEKSKGKSRGKPKHKTKREKKAKAVAEKPPAEPPAKTEGEAGK